MVTGGTTHHLLERFGGLCREMGMTPTQALEAFHCLPRGAQQACWDDLGASYAHTRGSVA